MEPIHRKKWTEIDNSISTECPVGIGSRESALVSIIRREGITNSLKSTPFKVAVSGSDWLAGRLMLVCGSPASHALSLSLTHAIKPSVPAALRDETTTSYAPPWRSVLFSSCPFATEVVVSVRNGSQLTGVPWDLRLAGHTSVRTHF